MGVIICGVISMEVILLQEAAVVCEREREREREREKEREEEREGEGEGGGGCVCGWRAGVRGVLLALDQINSYIEKLKIRWIVH